MLLDNSHAVVFVPARPPARLAVAPAWRLDVSEPPPPAGLRRLVIGLCEVGLALGLVLALPVMLMALLSILAAGVWIVLALVGRVF